MKKCIVIFLCCIGALYAECPKDWVESEYIYNILTEAGYEADLPVGLSHCVAYTESRFKPKAMSRVVKGFRSCGIMQIYRRYIVVAANLYHDGGYTTFNWQDPEDNSQVGCRYLSHLIKQFGGSVYLGVIAYNYGPTNLSNIKQLSDIPIECRDYADQIMALLDDYDCSWR